MDLTLEKNIEDRQKELNNLILLIAAGNGDICTVRQITEENADVNVVDTDGNTALHYAVRSGSLETVHLLLDKVKDANIENKENETPLDIASRHRNESIINALGDKVMNESFKLLKEAAVDAEAYDPALLHSADALTQVEQEIKNIQDKIKYCLDAIDKLKEYERDEDSLSYEQANVFIYFLEAFALEGSGDEDVKIKVKEHFSRYYSEKDRSIISDARDLLLKKSDKKIRLQDVRKFIKGIVNSFFEKLEKYVQGVHDKLTSTYVKNRTETELLSFLNVLEKKDRNLGEIMDDIRVFLKAELEKMITAAYGKQKITSEELFSFTMNFYPAFQKETKSGFKELTDMRNKLIHEFHKYGYVEFGNAIYSLRSTLFKYYYSQEVLKITSSIEPDDKPETISRSFQKRLMTFKEQFKGGSGTEQVISQEDAKASLGYVFSESLFPEKDDSGIEELVDQYLKFMVIIDSEKKEEYDVIDAGSEKEDRFNPNENVHEDKPHYQNKELSDVDRREIFEKFCKLKRIKNYCSKGYDEEKQKLRNELTNIYGVNAYHFDKVCSTFVEHNDEFSEKDAITVKEIAKTMKNLRKLKDNYKLSNQVIISLYDHIFGKHGLLVFEGNESLLKNIDQKTLQEIKNELPRDKTLEISIKNEIFCIRFGKVTRNMLKTFYNAYHKYQVEFNVEEIFNDEIFLDYLVRSEIKEGDIAELIDLHFKLLVFISSRKQREDHKSENHDDISAKEIFKIFKTLKKCRQHFCENDYDEKKEILKKKVVDQNFWLNDCDFDTMCELFVENDNDLDEKEIKEVEKIKRIINSLKSLGFSWQVITTLCEKLMDKKGNLNLEEDLSFLRKCDKSRKKKVKEQLEKLYKADLASKINVSFEKETVDLHTWTVTATVIDTFKEEPHFKKPFFTYMVIKKLLNVDHCAPYIVKLITEVKNDDIIEKNDLLKLLDILLKKEEGLYIKHLHALLGIGSGKLSLYDEVCKKMAERSVNIENMRIMLKEPYHLNKILNILRRKIELTDDDEQKKFIELMKEVAKVLNIIAYEMSSINNGVALEILEAANAAQQKMIDNNLMEETNFNALETRYQIGRIRNKLGRQELEKSKKAKLHEEALGMFCIIHERLRYKETPGSLREERNIRVHEMPLFLLASSKIAHTKHLLEKYEESVAEREHLCQEVVKFVLDLPKENHLPDNFLNAERYRDIEQAKNYQELLSFSEESEKYLDVLNIKSGIAFTKATQGIVEASNRKFAEALQYYYEALRIHKEVYAFRKIKFGPVYQTVRPAMRDISFISSRIAHLYLKMGNAQNALRFNYLALQKGNRLYETQKDMFCSNHVAVIKRRNDIVWHLRGIAYSCLRFGLKMTTLERKQWLEKSLEIYENIYHIQAQMHGEKHHWTGNTMYSLGSIKHRLGRLDEAKIILEELYNIRTEQLGETNEKTLECRTLLDKIDKKQGMTSPEFFVPFYYPGKQDKYSKCDNMN